jgi:prepilin-type N-terminal cleavage/methylation domain-containing protein
MMHRIKQKGFSLIEVSVTILLLTVVMIIFYELMIGSMRASMFVESHNDLVVVGQRVVNTIQTEILQAKMVFQEDTIGANYRTLFTNAGASVWTDSRLPVFELGAEPDPDGATPYTGNSLLLARQLGPLEFLYDHDQTNPPTCDLNAATPDVMFQGDQYRFEFYYLSPNTRRNFAGKGEYLEVMEAQSQVFGDYFQLNNLDECQRVQAIIGLRTAGIMQAWNPGKDIPLGATGPAFYDLQADGTLGPENTAPVFTLKMKTMMPELKGGRISGKMEYSVAFNSSSITNPNFTFPDAVPLYGQASNNFPGGLEFKGVDNAGVKKILTRVVLLSQHTGSMESQANFVVTSYNGL